MKVCMVVENIYYALCQKINLGKIHGIAVKSINLAKGLTKKNYHVSYITMDYGQPKIETVDGFTIYKIYKPNEGIPGFKFLFTKIPKLLEVLKTVNADIYIFYAHDPLVGVISWFCKKNKKIFIFYGSSDKDFDRENLKLGFRENFFLKYGINNANLIICQNNYQLKTLKKYYNRKGFILYNSMKRVKYTYNNKGHIIWVGNYDANKRPEMFIELSKKFDDTFVMVGGKSTSMDMKIYKNINKQATNNNIKILGPLNYDETDKLISNSKVLISTSYSEGFANVFLQAWRRGIPVISFVDPDNMIKANNLGIIVNNFNELIIAVKKVKKGISKKCSIGIHNFFNNTFSSEIISGKFDKLIKKSVPESILKREL